MSPAHQPLAGIRVLDLSTVLSGPLACYQLAQLGAEIVKVEPVGTGDLSRQLGADEVQNAARMGLSFLAQNAGKRSITINLKDPRGADLLQQLAGTADVLIENFRPGVMKRLGVDADTLRASNPALIYCAITGFGQDGPWRDRPAYDQIVQGAAGIMSVTGEAGGTPLRVGYPVADSIGGLTAAMAIAAALNAPERGGVIDVSMMESVLATMGWAVSNCLNAGVVPRPLGNDNMTSAPSGAFQCRDGLLNIAVNTEAQWQTLARFLRLDRFLDDPRFASRAARKAHRGELTVAIEERLAQDDAAVWAEALAQVGVPAGEVLSVPEALTYPQEAGRGQLMEFDAVLEDGRALKVMKPGFRIDGIRPANPAAPPRLGADTDAILAELGLDARTRERLRADCVI